MYFFVLSSLPHGCFVGLKGSSQKLKDSWHDCSCFHTQRAAHLLRASRPDGLGNLGSVRTSWSRPSAPAAPTVFSGCLTGRSLGYDLWSVSEPHWARAPHQARWTFTETTSVLYCSKAAKATHTCQEVILSLVWEEKLLAKLQPEHTNGFQGWWAIQTTITLSQDIPAPVCSFTISLWLMSPSRSLHQWKELIFVLL